MKKAKTQQNVVHFITSQVGQDSKAVLACQGRKATVRHGTTEEPVTCKRCFTQRVHDLPTALAALGITISQYSSTLWSKGWSYKRIDKQLEKMPGFQYLEY